MSPALLIAAAAALAAAPAGETLTPGEWPMFRGPNGQGVGAAALPADLIRDENLRWTVEVPGRGWGSPVVAAGPDGPTVYLPTATPDGTEMDVLAYDLNTGDRRWLRKLFRTAEPDFCHPTNTYASCTPVATDEAVFAHFGKYGTARLDPADGHLVWSRRDLECDHFRGPASSPLLVQVDGLSPRLIVPFDGVGEQDQYVVALDAATGETLWRYDRTLPAGTIPDKRKAYGTPVLWDGEGGPTVVSTGADGTAGLDPATGEELWRVQTGGMNSGTAPQLWDASALVCTGGAPTAVGRIDLSGSPSVAWLENRAAPARSTPLLFGSFALTVDDDGVAATHDLGDGDVPARARIGDEFWSSPVRGGDVSFAFGKGGAAVAFDLSAGDAAAEPVRSTTLDEGVWATPALAGGGLVLRTEHTLRFYHPGAAPNAGETE